MTGCINLTPRQEALLHSSPGPPVDISAREIRELLPAFAEIPDGDYVLVSRGTMPNEVWCNSFASDMFQPKDWDCKDYSYWADSMKPANAAFGIAWNKDHMVNWFIDEDKTVILFEPQECQFVRLSIIGMKI